MSSVLSLYDMYFSKKNKNHIFNLITEIVSNETGVDINSNNDYVDLYRFKYPLIFERSDSDNIVELNKELIDEIAPLLINDITLKYNKKNIQLETKNIQIENKDIQLEQDIQLDSNSNTKQIKEKLMNTIQINSSNRTNDSLNRYNYSIILDKSISVLGISEILIPEESNILFENPTICITLEIEKKEIDVFCRYSNKIILKNKQYNIYKPCAKIRLELDKPSNSINIKIRTNTKQCVLNDNDKIDIDKIKTIQLKNKRYICILTNTDLLEINEFINIYEDNKLLKTKKIQEIKDKYILLDFENINFSIDKKYYLIKNCNNNEIVLNYL